jgi:hypothetical protein
VNNLTSAFPIRLLLRCPACHEYAQTTRDTFLRAQPFCPQDGVPFQVISVASGCLPRDGECDFPVGIISGPEPKPIKDTSVVARCECVTDLAIA